MRYWVAANTLLPQSGIWLVPAETAAQARQLVSMTGSADWTVKPLPHPEGPFDLTNYIFGDP